MTIRNPRKVLLCIPLDEIAKVVPSSCSRLQYLAVVLHAKLVHNIQTRIHINLRAWLDIAVKDWLTAVLPLITPPTVVVKQPRILGQSLILLHPLPASSQQPSGHEVAITFGKLDGADKLPSAGAADVCAVLE